MLSLSVTIAPARAGLFDLNATTFDGFTITSQFTTADTLNAAGGYDILSIGGTVSNGVNTFTINGLEDNPSHPNASTSASEAFAHSALAGKDFASTSARKRVSACTRSSRTA